MSKTAPYRHFRDKESFLCALADEGFRLLCEALERGESISTNTEKGSVAIMGRAYMAFAVARPMLYRLMNSPISCRLPQENTLWARRSLTMLARALSGSAGGIDSDATAAAWGYIHGIVLLRIDGLFPADLPEPGWELLSSIVPRIPHRQA